MKKLFFIAAIAGVALASCTKNEVAQGGKQDTISFNTPVTSAVTKIIPGEIGEGEQKYPRGENFKVFAVHHTGNYASSSGTSLYMSEVEVQYGEDNNSWAPENVTGGVAYYWPENANSKLTFAAYSPADASGEIEWNAANGFKLTDFIVADATKNQYDLMFSERTMNKNSSTGGESYNGVDIHFKHALASIVFKAKRYAEYEGTTIKLYSISILNAYDKGTFEQGLVDDNTNTYQTGYPKWTPGTGESNYIVYKPATATSIEFDEEYTAIDNAVILLPQVFKHETTTVVDGVSTTSTSEVSVKVEYSIKTATGEEIKQEKIVSLETGNNNGQFTDDSGNNISAWEIGKRYTYTITFGLETIYFSPEVDVDWTPVTVQPGISI